MPYEQTPTPKTDLPSVSRKFLACESVHNIFLVKMEPSIINHMIGKYRITNRIAQGSFGEIYVGLGPNNEQVPFNSVELKKVHSLIKLIYLSNRLLLNTKSMVPSIHS